MRSLNRVEVEYQRRIDERAVEMQGESVVCEPESMPPADALLWYNTLNDVQCISCGGGDVVPFGGLGGEA